MTQNLFSVLGYNDFWERFDFTFPTLEPAWYEVYIDFMDDIYNPSLSEEQNLWNAYKYIEAHRNDYD